MLANIELSLFNPRVICMILIHGDDKFVNLGSNQAVVCRMFRMAAMLVLTTDNLVW